jgi:hypothetical protein
MAGVRIKDLQDAKSVIDKFDEMQFAVDSGNPDTTLRLSGKDLKAVIGTPKQHTHPVEEVDGLPGGLRRNSTPPEARSPATCTLRLPFFFYFIFSYYLKPHSYDFKQTILSLMGEVEVCLPTIPARRIG